MKTRGKGTVLATAAGIVALGLLAGRCAPSAPKGAKRRCDVSDVAAAAMKIYVAPGDLDEYYMFASGGHSGQVYVYGLPSMRHLSTIPVYTPYPATGYGFDDESKAMLGDLTWGDLHHPALSETKGDYDGRWLFVNDMNGRVARIDLRDFKTKQILGPIPNVSGNHASTFVTPNSEYVVMGSRFSIPIPKGTVAGIDKYATEYKGVVTGIKIDPQTGELSFGWQILMPPFDYDLGDAGKLASDGFVFFSSYNTERATGKLEVTATQRDRDYIAVVDWRMAEKLAAEGEGTMIGGVKVLDPGQAPRARLLHALRQVAPRRRRLPRRQVHHRLRQAPGRHHRLQLREGPDRDAQQGLRGRRGRHPRPQVRVDQGRRGAGRPRPAAHPVRPRRLRLHLALRRQRDRQVEARDLGGRGQGPDVLLDRPPERGRGRHREPGRQVPGRPQQAVPRPAPLGGSVAAGVEPARRHHRGEDEAAPRRLHRARAALRPDHQGRQDPPDRGLPEGGEQAPAGDLGRQGRRRDPQGQQGHW